METQEIKEAASKILEAKQYYTILNNFGVKKFNEKFPREERIGMMWYSGFNVIDENTIKVNYQYGGGDMEMDGSFEVKI